MSSTNVIFCKDEEETIQHNFINIDIDWMIISRIKQTAHLKWKTRILSYINKTRTREYVNLHKSKSSKPLPCIELFIIEFGSYIQYVKLINNKTCVHTISLLQEFFKMI